MKTYPRLFALVVTIMTSLIGGGIAIWFWRTAAGFDTSVSDLWPAALGFVVSNLVGPFLWKVLQ